MNVDREYARDSLMFHANNKKHLCETLRRVYDYIYELPKGQIRDGATEELIDAMMMAKKMQDRLHYYQNTYHDDTGNKAKNIVGLTGVKNTARLRHDRKYAENHR
jgi:hypothetical protein